MIDAMKIADHYDALRAAVADGKLHTKEEYLRLLILQRFLIRSILRRINDAEEEARYYTRQRKLLANQGIVFLLVDVKIQEAKENVTSLRNALISFGGEVCVLLDCWQAAGATLRELCSLCSASYDRLQRVLLSPEDQDSAFGNLMLVYSIDYPGFDCTWADLRVDAPFTHATREYMFDKLVHAKKGKLPSSQSIQDALDDLIKRIEMDAEGHDCLFDKNGEMLGRIGPEPERE